MLLLPKMELLSLKGIDNVGAKIGDIWGKEIVEKQLHHLAAGINIPPIRSLANVCNGACDVVLLPLKQYQEGGHISSSLRTSTSNFVHTLSLEALTNASRLAATTQTILESAHDYLASSSSKHGSKKGFVTTNSKRSKNNRKRRNSRQSYNETFRSAPSVFSDQPANVTEALNQAAQRLSTRFNSSQRTVVAVPIGKYKEKGKACLCFVEFHKHLMHHFYISKKYFLLAPLPSETRGEHVTSTSRSRSRAAGRATACDM